MRGEGRKTRDKTKENRASNFKRARLFHGEGAAYSYPDQKVFNGNNSGDDSFLSPSLLPHLASLSFTASLDIADLSLSMPNRSLPLFLFLSFSSSFFEYFQRGINNTFRSSSMLSYQLLAREEDGR